MSTVDGCATICAIIPVKPLHLGKSRLAGILNPQERLDLNRRLLIHTLDTLTSIQAIKQVLVVSCDPVVLHLGDGFGARSVMEKGSPGLNTALAHATKIAGYYNPTGLLIIPADLPLINPGAVQDLLAAIRQPPIVVIAPDRRREGTNAMLVCPPGLIDYEFGPGSFVRHCAHTRQVGARLQVYDLPALALDIDLPEDLELVSKVLEYPD